MTADDSMKSQCAQSGMKGQVGSFQNQGVCLQAFPSFPSPTPSLFLLSPHFRAGKTPKPPFFAFSSLFASRKRLLRRLLQISYIWSEILYLYVMNFEPNMESSWTQKDIHNSLKESQNKSKTIQK